MAPPVLGDEQINCGPIFPNRRIGDRWISRTTPYGVFDVAEIIRALPADQYPDVVVCHVDCGFGVRPRNLASLRCPAVLLAADSHWGKRGISSMVSYAASEPFERIIVLYDRHHLDFYRAAGLKNVHWIPGLTFAHPDSRIEAAARQQREARLALVGKVGYHFRRRRLFAALLNAKLPLAWRELRQAEAIAHYGASLIGINVVMNADLNLRVFETIAGGAMLLTDGLSPAAGLDHLLAEGREKVSYGDEHEFVERASHYLAHPAEAQAIGEAGRRWFMAHFSEQKRREAFADLVFSGRERPEFATEPAGAVRFDFSSAGLRPAATLIAYDVVNELHRQQETVTVELDATVPPAVEAMLGTLPRVRAIRSTGACGQQPSDLLICGREALKAQPIQPAGSLWVWNCPPEAVASLPARIAVPGLAPVQADLPVFQAREVPLAAHQQKALEARKYLEAGDLASASTAAQAALAANPACADACLVLAELAWGVGRVPLFEKMLAAAVKAEPGNPGIALLRWSTAHPTGPMQVNRLMAMGWRTYESLNPGAALRYAQAVLAADAKRAEAHHLRALASSFGRASGLPDQAARQRLQEEIAALEAATALQPDAADYWLALGIWRAEAEAWAAARAAFRRVVQLDGTQVLAWYGIGEAALALGAIPEALEAFSSLLKIAPGSAAAKLARVRALRLGGDWSAAERELAEIRQAHPREQGIWAETIRLHCAAGNHVAAREALAAFAREGGSGAPYHQLAGEVALGEGANPGDAAASFTVNTKARFDVWSHQSWLGRALLASGDSARGMGVLRYAASLAPTVSAPWVELARGGLQCGRTAEALDAAMEAAELEPESCHAQAVLAAVAEAVGHPVLARHARQALARLNGAPNDLAGGDESAAADQPVRDLVISHVEINRLQGSGVLLQRFFGKDNPEFVTLRSRTQYDGVVEFGGTHFILDIPGLSPERRKARLGRLLSAYRIRRILCVPFFAEDFLHGALAAELTGAPLLAYVMDDQTLHAKEVPTEFAQRLFQAARVRLTISPEMQAAYREKFGLEFGCLPPVVAHTDLQVANHWTPATGPVDRCAMVGNVWTAGQFQQIRDFARESGWKIDWFGNAHLPHLPSDWTAVEADGVFRRGFLPEAKLAEALAGYPFVLLPSGRLDGTEDNEWLTRLSIPSRMVFIVTQTHTPMLVLGSPAAAAASFVLRFDLGLCAADHVAAAQAAARLGDPVARAHFVEQARRVTPAFVMPQAGSWLWDSLAAGQPRPTAIDEIYATPAPSATAAVVR